MNPFGFKYRYRDLLAVTFIVCAISAVVIYLRQIGFIQPYELSLYDRYIRNQAPTQEYDTPVVLIRITEEDLHALNYPISDEIMARVLENLLSYGPVAIGVDVYRDLPSEGRERLQNVVENNPNIVMVEKRLGKPVPGPDFVSNPNQLGFADLKLDGDGILRRGLLFLWDLKDAPPTPSFSLLLALNYLSNYGITLMPDKKNEGDFKLNQTTVPRFNYHDGGYSVADDGGYQVLMDYKYGVRPFPSFTISEVLENQSDLKSIKGKVVILGATARSLRDHHLTPFNLTTSKSMFGIEIHGHMVDQLVRTGLIDERPLQYLDEWLENGLIVTLALIATTLGVVLRSIFSIVFIAVTVVTLYLTLPSVLFAAGYWMPLAVFMMTFVAGMTTAMVYIGFMNHLELKTISSLFGIFVANDVAKKIWDDREHFIAGGRPKSQTLFATVVMTDIKDYTAVAESLGPDATMEWLNVYLSEMTKIVETNQGIVEDYAGDGIKATFGIPVPRSSDEDIKADARNAIKCALDMGRKIVSLKKELENPIIPFERIRIGVSSGVITAGSIGYSNRMAYISVGDTVNVAARLESFGKEQFERESNTACRILISESTQNLVGNEFPSEFIGCFQLKGRRKKTKIYRIISAKSV